MSRNFTTILNTDNGTGDAFGRLRVSNTETLFDSKQLYDSQPLFWDDEQSSGTGTGSTYNTNQASTTISVSNLTAGKRVRQTFQRMNYQPGKGQRILMTCSNLLSTTGITKGFGYGDDKNGLFLINDGGILKFVRRTYTSGSAVDNEENITLLDKNGNAVNTSKTMILDIDFEWLGVGRVRAGYVEGASVTYFYAFTGVNNLDVVYMSSPNLPLIYWIENDGTGAASSFTHICSSVMSEGGSQDNGILRHESSSLLTGLTSGTKYAVLGIRLKTTSLDSVIKLFRLSILSTTQNDQFKWEILFNPTIEGTFTYSDQTNSSVQTASGANTNTVTGGTKIDGAYGVTASPISEAAENALKLGSAIDGTRDEIVLCVRPITNNISVEGSLTWRELS